MAALLRSRRAQSIDWLLTWQVLPKDLGGTAETIPLTQIEDRYEG